MPELQVVQRRSCFKMLSAFATGVLVMLMLGTWLLRSGVVCQSIDRLPVAIESPGCFRLSSDLDFADPAGYAITLQANDIILDLAGHRISAQANAITTSVGIYAQGRKRLQISNGTLENFFYGVRADRGEGPAMSSDIVVQNLTIMNSTFRGIMINGPRAKIVNNSVFNTGGTTLYQDAFAIGIEVFGPNCDIAGNTIDETYPVGIGEGIGISASAEVAGCIIQSNRISNKQTPQTSRILGVWIDVAGLKSVIIRDNTFSGLTYAFMVPRTSSRAWPDNFNATFINNKSSRTDRLDNCFT